VACSRLSGHIQPSKRVYFTLQRSSIELVRPLSTVDNTRDYARVSHSTQWSNYNVIEIVCCQYTTLTKTTIIIILHETTRRHLDNCRRYVGLQGVPKSTISLGRNLHYNILRSSYDKIYVRIIVRQC